MLFQVPQQFAEDGKGRFPRVILVFEVIEA
jgi:hypothetical protein